MNVLRLIAREILYRKLSFALGVLSVLIAAGVLVAEYTLLRAHDLRTGDIVAAKQAEAEQLIADFDRRTERIIARKEAETRRQMAAMQDDYRKIMKKLGFNILILPKGQNLGDLFADDYAVKTMPEEYVKKLANSRIMLIRHLLPILQAKLKWPEQERTILLIGTRGEVPLAHRKPKEPMLTLVERDHIVLGYELHRGAGVKAGDKLKLLGHEFTVAKCHPERGTKDDITVWVNLAQAQELLGKEGKINGIMALQCFCAESLLPRIRREVAAILPDTQVIEFQTKVIIRAEARQRAADTAKQALAAEKTNRAQLRTEREDYAQKAIAAEKTARAQLKEQREGFAAVLVPLVVVGAIAWIAYLGFSNVRERRPEIGILRALGVRRAQVFAIFLGKAMITGVLGAALGCLGGFVVGVATAETHAASLLFEPTLVAAVIVLSPLLSALASWLPALTATQQDPAVVLTNG